MDGKPLKIEVEDIYFITRLSHRGEVVNLRDHGIGGGMTVEDCIATYCLLDTQKVGSQVPIIAIMSLRLKIKILVLGRISSSTALH